MPNHLKHPDVRQRRNKPAPLREVLPPASPDPAPSPPADLLPTTRDLWEQFWTSAVAASVDRISDLPALHRLWSLYDERERTQRAYRRRRLMKGASGQPVVSPLQKVLVHLDGEIRQLEDRFGLTPLARLRLGIAIGDAARSLDDLNRLVEDSDNDGDTFDPRIIDAI